LAGASRPDWLQIALEDRAQHPGDDQQADQKDYGDDTADGP
jgi:hypothetical protein